MVDTKRPRFVIPVSELLTVCAILSLLYAFLLPAINIARDRQKLPPVNTVLVPFYEGQIYWFIAGFPVVTTCCLAAGIVLVRGLLPPSIRARFPWSDSKKPESAIHTPANIAIGAAPEKPAAPVWAIVSAILASSATGVLFFAASRIHADRTRRRPVITFEGWLADYTLPVAIMCWVLSWIAIMMAAVYVASPSSPISTSRLKQHTACWNGTAALGLILGALNLFGSCFYWGILTED